MIKFVSDNKENGKRAEPGDDLQFKFWLESRVAVAKSASFIASAEESVSKGNYVTGAICAYYTFFHFGLFLMWLFPELTETKLKGEIVRRRNQGEDLPAPGVPTHKQIEEFLKGIRTKLELEQLDKIFSRAQSLRNYVNYGPRAYYVGKQAYVGHCEHSPVNVNGFIQGYPCLFRSVIETIWSRYDTNKKKSMVVGALSDSLKLLKDPQFPFVNWFPDSVLNRAVKIIESYIGCCK